MKFQRFKLMQAAIVVALDMRSSSLIVDDLTSTGKQQALVEFIASIKHFLADTQVTLRFDPHKFSGDSWILLFFPDTDGAALLTALRNLCTLYDREYAKHLLPNLTDPPAVTGLAFGIDAGRLYKMTIFQQTEYFAPALNVACRLQGEAKKLPARFGTFVSQTTFDQYFASASAFESATTTRDLRGIRNGARFPCVSIDLKPAN